MILSDVKEELHAYEKEIAHFLRERLSLEIHPEKTKIVKMTDGVGFLGFRIFPYHKLLRKKNMKKFEQKLRLYQQRHTDSAIDRHTVASSLQGWLAYSAQANTYKYRRHIVRQFNQWFPEQLNVSHPDTITEFRPEKCEDAPLACIPIAKSAHSKSFQRRLDEADTPFTIQKTHRLFNRGIPIEQIAQQRRIKVNTVWAHLSKLIEYNQMPLLKAVQRERANMILSAIHSEKDQLIEIKARLKDRAITFNEIDCALAHYRLQNKKKKPHQS